MATGLGYLRARQAVRGGVGRATPGCGSTLRGLGCRPGEGLPQELAIPLPGRGHWAKAKVGKAPSKRSLPPLPRGVPSSIVSYRTHSGGGARDPQARKPPKGWWARRRQPKPRLSCPAGSRIPTSSLPRPPGYSRSESPEVVSSPARLVGAWTCRSRSWPGRTSSSTRTCRPRPCSSSTLPKSHSWTRASKRSGRSSASQPRRRRGLAATVGLSPSTWPRWCWERW